MKKCKCGVAISLNKRMCLRCTTDELKQIALFNRLDVVKDDPVLREDQIK
jgi:hypothetical protein